MASLRFFDSKLASTSSRLRHNRHSHINFLRLISLSRSTQHLKPLYALLTVHGLQSHSLFVAEFLRSCFHLGHPRLALLAYGRVEKPRLSLTNSMIRRLCQCGLHGEAVRVFSRRRISDEFTFPSVIKSCADLGDERTGKQTHCVVFRTGFEKNLAVQTTLVHFYAKCGRMADARHVLDGIPQPDSVALNALIAGYSSNGFDCHAAEAFRRSGLEPNMSTLASLIPVCSRLGWTRTGKSLHCFSVKSGHAAGDFLVPALISMYIGGGGGGCGSDLPSARSLFDSAPRESVSVWNSMISAYTNMRMPIEASVTFQMMLENGLSPDTITYVSIIPSCNSESLGQSLHSSAMKNGSGDKLPVSAALVSMYAKLGDVASAELVFDRMPRRDRLTWNSLISGYASVGQWESSLTAFGGMQSEGFCPDEVSVVSLISACSKSAAIRLGRSLHALTVKRGFGSILNVTNALLAFYSGCGRISPCFDLFHEMNVRSTISWNTLISCCIHNREIETARTVFRRMRGEGVDVDTVTLISTIPVLSETEGMAFHCFAVKSGLSKDVSLVNALISAYCFGCGDLDSGRSLFEEAPEKCVVTWNSLLTGARDRGSGKDVLELFGRMVRDGKRPNHVTLLALLPFCDTELQGKTVHGSAVVTGMIRETPLATSLMSMYTKFGDVGSCLSLFRLGRKEDISLWNAAMSAHAQAGNPRDAISLFSSLVRDRIEPDRFTARSLIAACTRVNSLALADSVTSHLIRKGLDGDLAVANALIGMYSKCGDLSASRKVFDGMTRRDAASWGTMINAYGLHGYGETALELFREMGDLGVEADGGVYMAVMSACGRSGMAAEGIGVFGSMGERRHEREHYGCLVDLLARGGNLREARQVVKRMPYEASAAVLEAVLGGCGVHGEVEIGEEIGRALFELEPEKSGPYVALHNIYAASGRWVDAERVRSQIEQRGLTKLPAFSLCLGEGI